jgi:E3 ubiquitin-protein ligase TRIP12
LQPSQRTILISQIYLKEKLLLEGLRGPNALAAPFIFDIRGGGGFWGIEFDGFDNNPDYDLKGEGFAMLVQARALDNNLVIMGFTGGSNLEGTKGSHCLLAPAYNSTKEEIELIASRFIQSVEDVIREHSIKKD